MKIYEDDWYACSHRYRFQRLKPAMAPPVMSSLALIKFLLIIACSPSSHAADCYFPDNQGVGARSYVLKRGYFKPKTYFYSNHVATFNLAKLHLVDVHPNPGPSEYDIRRAAGLKTFYM